jgi:phosphoglycolate phosphatase-like HAD superfamily hydrolase
MQSARAGGLYAIGVSWGRIHPPERLTDADVIIHHAHELLDLV